MKKQRLIMTAATAVLLSSICFSVMAQLSYNFSSPTYGTFASQSDLDTISGVTAGTSSPWVIAVDTDNSIVCVNDPSGGTGSLVDLNGGASGSIIVSESGVGGLDAAQLTPSGDLDIDDIAIDSAGTVYICEHDGDDDIIKIVRSPSATASNLALRNGVTSLALDEANGRLIITEEQGFGATADQLTYINTTTGAATIAASTSAITTASGAGGVSAVGITKLAGGNFVFFDEGNFGGAEAILEFNPNTSVVSVKYATGAFTDAPGIDGGIRATAGGDLIMWDEFSSGDDGLLIIDRNGVNTKINEATLIAGIGLTETNFQPQVYGGVAIRETGTSLIVYLADTFDSGGIHTVTFPALGPASVDNWNLY